MPTSRLLRIAALCAPLALSCSSSDAPATPVTFSFDIASLDGHRATDQVNLRCDVPTDTQAGDTGPSTRQHSTLAVAVSFATDPENRFVLRPPQACGTSSFCGYVRFEALDGDNAVLAQVDSATTEGVLELEIDQLAQLVAVRASLLHGVDDTVVQNPDGTDVVATAKPTFVVPDPCEVTPTGSGGEGGQAGQGGMPSVGGAGGESPTGAGGSSQAGAPQAGGAGGEPVVGGAGAGGSP